MPRGRYELPTVPVYRLPDDLVFPHPSRARRDGLLAVGGDLSPRRLILGYENGIFPWYSEGQPILWWSPPVRPILAPGNVHVPHSLKKTMARKRFEIVLDSQFAEVIAGCATTPRGDETGTWITQEMMDAYNELHRMGLAHSAEAWHEGKLVGGLYGVALGGAFFGESMFAREADASKVAFVTLCAQLQRWSFDLIDSQVSNAHTARFGTIEIPREEFLQRVAESTKKPNRTGPWVLDEDLRYGPPKTPSET